MAYPKVFISYSWDSEPHKEWVRNLGARLRGDGVDVTLDRWHLVEGDQLSHFMEAAIRDNQYVLIVCTPEYKIKADSRQGGVGYEGNIITAQRLAGGNPRKFIPILRAGTWTESLPIGLGMPLGIDFRGDRTEDEAYLRLLERIHNQGDAPPPIGPIPAKRNQRTSDHAHARTRNAGEQAGHASSRQESLHTDTPERKRRSSFRELVQKAAGLLGSFDEDMPPDQERLCREVIEAMEGQLKRSRNLVALHIANARKLSAQIQSHETKLRDQTARARLALKHASDNFATQMVRLALETEHQLLLIRQSWVRAVALERFHKERLTSLQNSLEVAKAEIATLAENDRVLSSLPSPDPSEHDAQRERYNAFVVRWSDSVSDDDLATRADTAQLDALGEFRRSPEGVRLARLQVRDEQLVQETLQEYWGTLLGRRP